MAKIKLIVLNENVLGYIFPELPKRINVLRVSSEVNQYIKSTDITFIKSTDIIRLANEVDFDKFRVSFEGYKNNPNEYEFN